MIGQRWRGWLLASAIFITGIAVGASVATWAGARLLRHNLRNPANSQGLAFRAMDRIAADLDRSLKLTSEESARVRALLDETSLNLRRVRQQAFSQTSDEMRASIRRIAAELPPEKQEACYRIISKRFERLGIEPIRKEKWQAEKEKQP